MNMNNKLEFCSVCMNSVIKFIKINENYFKKITTIKLKNKVKINLLSLAIQYVWRNYLFSSNDLDARPLEV